MVWIGIDESKTTDKANFKLVLTYLSHGTAPSSLTVFIKSRNIKKYVFLK